MAVMVTVPALFKLFRIDRDLQVLQTALAGVQRSGQVQQAKIDQILKTIETQEATVQKHQVLLGGFELELKTRQEHIEKMRTSLNATKTNKEYSAILIQISAEKAEVAKHETSMLEQMTLIEAAGKIIAAQQPLLAAEKATLAKILSEHAGRVGELQKQIQILLEARTLAVKEVPADPLKQYERSSIKMPGDAMAPLDYDENDLDSISCGSCYLGINVEVLNCLRGRDEIRKCTSCGRILYLPEMFGEPVREGV